MNARARICCGAMLAMSLLTGACTTLPGTGNPVPQGPDVLVTFAMSEHTMSAPGGSNRSYHSGAAWQVPLYTRQQARRFAHDHGLVERNAWPIDLLGVYCVSYTAIEPTSPSQLVDRLHNDPRSTLAQANAQFTGMTTTETQRYDDPLLDVQYGDFAQRLEALHSITGGAEVKIGVIDTSVDLEHPDLAGQVAQQTEFVPAETQAARLHGTAVTGVIAAAADNGEGLVGIAPDAEIHVYGACSHQGETTMCTSFSIAQALAEAIEQKMDVINMSFAGPEDPLIQALLEKAVAADTVLVAAGNSSAPGQRFPAGLPGVHAADGDQQLWFARPERLSTRAGGSYQVFFGSSIASAGMTGLAALVRSGSSTAESHALLDWLYDGDCSQSPPPTTSCAINPAHLCE